MTRGLKSNNHASKQQVQLFPLTQPQQRIWYMDVLNPGTSISTVTATIKIQGPLDVTVLKMAFNEIIRQHNGLQIRITTNNQIPQQYVEKHANKDFECIDFSGAEQSGQSASEWVMQHIQQPIQLLEADLYEFVILKISDEEHWYNIKVHHIVIDGVAMSMVINQITQCYLDYMRGESLGEDERHSYLDFLQTELDYEASDRYQKDKAFWFEKFVTLPEALGLKLYNPVTLSTEALRETMTIRDDIYDGIKAFCANYKVSLFTFFLAAFYIYMNKVTSLQDIAIGTAYANRTTKKEKDTVGMYVSTIATRAFIDPESDLISFLQNIAKEQASILRHQRYPYNKLIQDLKDIHSYSDIQRLFGITVQYRTLSWLDHEEINYQVDAPFAGHTGNDFDVHVVEMLDDQQFRIHIDYRSQLYDTGEIAQIFRQYMTIVEHIIQQPNSKIGHLSLISEEEAHTVLTVFNPISADYSSEKTIHQWFEEQVERTPEQWAVVSEGNRLTYRELNEQANRLARTLQAEGVGAGQLVGLMVERSLDMIIGIFGIMKAGGAYIPIDPEYPEERIRYMLEDSGAQLLLLQDRLRGRVSFAGTIIALDQPDAFSEDGSNLQALSTSSDLAYVIYTSGTTGRPKGVMVEHHGLGSLRTFFDRELQIDANDRIVQFASFSFDASSWEILMALYVGATLYIPSSSVIFNYSLFERFITDNGITVATLPPTYAIYLEPANMPSLKKLITAGSAPSVELVQAWKDHVQYFNAYGPTEDSICSTIWAYSAAFATHKFVSIGRPIFNHHIYIVDANENLLPVGVAGELCLAGEGLARGYLNLPEMTAEKFVANPFIQGERMYKTGDLAKWMPDGNIEYLGRIDHQVKIRGYRIELSEIEAQIMKANSVQETIVIAQDDEKGQKQLAAYFVAAQSVTSGELRAILGQEMPAYMIPSYFVQLEQMPLTPNGKIDRRALPAPQDSAQTGTEYAAPRTPVEQVLATIWQKVLGAAKVGIYTNFFELGGDSIKSIQVSSRLYQEGYKLETKDFFQHPTIAELSGLVQSVSRTADQGEVVGAVGLTPVQLWFFEHNESDRHHFNQALMLYRELGFNEDILREVATKIAKHHDALRAVFHKSESGSYEARNRGVNDGELFSLDVFDLRGEAECSAAIEAKANELQSSINLSEGPLIKLGLFHCADGDHLLIVIHHLVVDGVSWRILIEDLAAGYEQFEKGEEIRLPQKSDSFQTWAEQLATYANSPALEKDRAYWQRVIQSDVAPLPKDFAHNESLVSESEIVTVQWTELETEQLLKHAHRAYHTDVNDLLLTALGTALHEWTGMERIAVNMEGHGREDILTDVDITRTVGWFTSQYPVVLEIGLDQEMSHRIKSVKEELRGIPQKGIGYGILRYLSEPRECEELHAKAEIGFNYLGQFDQDLASSAMQFSHYPVGSSVSGNAKRPFTLDLNGMIARRALTLTISYSIKQYRSETIERLAGLLQESLRKVVAHCVSRENAELTPSDVNLKGLTVEELDRLVMLNRPFGEMEDIYPLSPMQKGMLFDTLMNPQSGAYFEQASFDLLGRFQVEAFEQSMQALIGRHPILRTNFNNGWQDQPLQVVYRTKQARFHYEDLSEMNETERQVHMAAVAENDKAQGFNLMQDTLMRVTLLRTGEKSYHVIWSFHHIVMDGWCLSLVIKEVFDTYFAILEQRRPELVEVTPYSQYIAWLEAQDSTEAADYWNSYLAGYDQQTLLPKANLQEKTAGYAAIKRAYNLGHKLTEQMNRTARQQQVTLNTLLQTVWGIILQKYSNNQDVVFGSVVSGRAADIPGIETMIGLFINTVPVRVRCEADAHFSDVLKWNQEQMLASRDYETFPLYDIQALTEQKQDLINHIMVFENYPLELHMEQTGSDNSAGLTIANAAMSEQTNYDFNLNVIPGDDIRIDFEYNGLVYDEANIERMFDHLVYMLEQVTENPRLRVNELKLVTAQQYTQLIETFSGRGAEGQEHLLEKPFHVYVEEQVQR
ncbi:amino acid adenylation domain-containing protein, partial [Paenibacillus sp. SI8]|uniref:amino acid adenylation domain-containing protein n=1 Tax=unclassified Paenibacillus TaxID=185978 RepID=UPI003465E956